MTSSCSDWQSANIYNAYLPSGLTRHAIENNIVLSVKCWFLKEKCTKSSRQYRYLEKYQNEPTPSLHIACEECHYHMLHISHEPSKLNRETKKAERKKKGPKIYQYMKNPRQMNSSRSCIFWLVEQSIYFNFFIVKAAPAPINSSKWY